MGKTLSIETGIRCNNRCSFCYQKEWRCREASLPDPSTDELMAKLEWGIGNGYESVGFSGGEPTLRQDFLELVRRARELGYARVSLTTNGRRLSNPAYARELLEAGVSGIGWSLHGPSEEVHDLLVGRQGAFKQSVRGIRNVARLVSEMGLRVDQNVFFLMNRHNHQHLASTCLFGRRLGIKLFIVQPIIFSKGNLSTAAGLQVPLTAVVRSVRKAATLGARGEWFIKLFNLPPCLFHDILELFEHQRYPVEVFRLQESASAGESAGHASSGTIRMERCRRCRIRPFCPGLHQSLLSQDDLLALVRQSLEVPADPTEIWLTGLELLRRETLVRLLKEVREIASARVLKVYYGGDSVAGADFLPAVIRGGANRIVYLVRGFEPDTEDLSRKGSGNLDNLSKMAEHPLLSSSGPVEKCIAAPLIDSTRRALMNWLEGMPGLAGWRFEIDMPSDFKDLDLFDIPKWAGMALEWKRLGGGPVELVLPHESEAASARYRLPVRALMKTVESDRHFVRHCFSGPFGEWASLTQPHYLSGREQDRAGEMNPVVKDLMGEAIVEADLDRMNRS